MTILPFLSMYPHFPCSTTRNRGPVLSAGDCGPSAWLGCAVRGSPAEFFVESDSAKGPPGVCSSACKGQQVAHAVRNDSTETVANRRREFMSTSLFMHL